MRCTFLCKTTPVVCSYRLQPPCSPQSDGQSKQFGKFVSFIRKNKDMEQMALQWMIKYTVVKGIAFCVLYRQLWFPLEQFRVNYAKLSSDIIQQLQSFLTMPLCVSKLDKDHMIFFYFFFGVESSSMISSTVTSIELIDHNFS